MQFSAAVQRDRTRLGCADGPTQHTHTHSRNTLKHTKHTRRTTRTRSTHVEQHAIQEVGPGRPRDNSWRRLAARETGALARALERDCGRVLHSSVCGDSSRVCVRVRPGEERPMQRHVCKATMSCHAPDARGELGLQTHSSSANTHITFLNSWKERRSRGSTAGTHGAAEGRRDGDEGLPGGAPNLRGDTHTAPVRVNGDEIAVPRGCHARRKRRRPPTQAGRPRLE